MLFRRLALLLFAGLALFAAVTGTTSAANDTTPQVAQQPTPHCAG